MLQRTIAGIAGSHLLKEAGNIHNETGKAGSTRALGGWIVLFSARTSFHHELHHKAWAWRPAFVRIKLSEAMSTGDADRDPAIEQYIAMQRVHNLVFCHKWSCIHCTEQN